ncbi:unnamed protein product [Rotaria sp. Silwood2]|nr:unnamed protein product [Rotaria sp. Silwood2]CAF4417459.1 unnamed protein product [Rotaria sp. Silwood2]
MATQCQIFTRHLSTVYSRVFRSTIDRSEEFSSEQAQNIKWLNKWPKVYNKTDLIHPHWFQNGQLNMTYNCLD